MWTHMPYSVGTTLHVTEGDLVSDYSGILIGNGFICATLRDGEVPYQLGLVGRHVQYGRD